MLPRRPDGSTQDRWGGESEERDEDGLRAHDGVVKKDWWYERMESLEKGVFEEMKERSGQNATCAKKGLK